MSQPLREQLAGKRFGVVLSAGFFGFYGHAGFVKALADEKLEPAAWAGSSAGGLVAAFAAGGASPSRIEELVLAQNRQSFWDPDPLGAVLDLARSGIGASGLLKGNRFRALLESTLPSKRFEDLRTALLLVAANLTRSEPEVFTRKGDLAAAVHATCAYPGLFRAVRLHDALYWDGGLVDKAPALALAEAHPELEAILVHYLPSRASGALGGALAYAQGMAAGMAALRRDHFRLQLEVLKARGVAVHVIVSRLPAVSPRSMAKGKDALAEAHRSVRRAFEKSPRPFDAGD